tara:strand:+ start:3855 stop:4691 length:837 start_codon:yes stop_codon:yes gene_type:complete
LSNCYDFDGKLKKIFGQDKLFLDDLESTWLGSFNRAIKKFLIEKNITETDDFDLNQIHNHVGLEYQVTDTNGDGISKLGQMFYDIKDESYFEIYHKFLKEIRDEVLKCDFYFQEIPTIRFWFKGQKTKHKYHSDIHLGHPPEEINLWWAFTNNEQTGFVVGDNLKDCEDWYSKYNFDRDSFLKDAESPTPIEEFNSFGEGITSEVDSNRIIMFDSRMIHSAIDRSSDDTTRVSMDIRLNPVDEFKDGYTGLGRMKAQFKPGGKYGYHPKSIDQIWSER